MDLTRGAFRLFRAAGIDVYLHWSWFLVAWWLIGYRDRVATYHDQVLLWKTVEYVSLFAIVLMHEFGHALACRSVGGRADQIVLWPLGGVAYVAPPPRPGAVLWSIVAGPLVNFVLLFPTVLMWYYAYTSGWRGTTPDLYQFLSVLTLGNAVLLVFNLLPIYPLDGGQILHALLWFVLGRWRSLQVVSAFGVALGGVLFILSLVVSVVDTSAWLLSLIAAFIIFRSAVSFQQSRTVLSLLELPRHDDCACPHCEIGPPKGAFWVCEHCHTRFDLFDTHGKCLACGAWYLNPDCPHCRHTNHIDQWFAHGAVGVALEASEMPFAPPAQSPPT